jgi:hypothetical protein
MPQVGFEPMLRVFERAKTVHALDRAANMIGWMSKLGSDNKSERREIETAEIRFSRPVSGYTQAMCAVHQFTVPV